MRRAENGIAPRDLAVTDAQGVIQGLGVASPVGSRGEDVRWEGVVRGFDPAARYAAYGVLPDGKSVCLLAPLARVPVKMPLAPNPGS